MAERSENDSQSDNVEITREEIVVSNETSVQGM